MRLRLRKKLMRKGDKDFFLTSIIEKRLKMSMMILRNS